MNQVRLSDAARAMINSLQFCDDFGTVVPRTHTNVLRSENSFVKLDFGLVNGQTFIIMIEHGARTDV